MHGFTYSSHPISLAAGRAVLNHIKQHDLVDAADSDHPGSIAAKLKDGLGALQQLAAVGDVRGIGLLWAIEFVADKASKGPFPANQNFSGLVAQAATDRGLLVYPGQGCAGADCGDHILLAPPAVISPGEVDWACEQLSQAILETTPRKGR